MASPVVPFALDSGTGDVAHYEGQCTLFGYSLYESGTPAAAASVVLRDGTDASGKFIVRVDLNAEESTRDWFGDLGIRIEVGIFVDRLSGSSAGAIWRG